MLAARLSDDEPGVQRTRHPARPRYGRAAAAGGRRGAGGRERTSPSPSSGGWRADRRSRKVDRASVVLPGMEGLGLKPWWEVITPHQDIVDGNFNASQFAANLYNVVNGKATLRVPGPGRVLPPHLPDRGPAGPARPGRPAGRRRHERLAGHQPADELRRRQDALDARAVPPLLRHAPARRYPQDVQEHADGTRPATRSAAGPAGA